MTSLSSTSHTLSTVLNTHWMITSCGWTAPMISYKKILIYFSRLKGDFEGQIDVQKDPTHNRWVISQDDYQKIVNKRNEVARIANTRARALPSSSHQPANLAPYIPAPPTPVPSRTAGSTTSPAPSVVPSNSQNSSSEELNMKDLSPADKACIYQQILQPCPEVIKGFENNGIVVRGGVPIESPEIVSVEELKTILGCFLVTCQEKNNKELVRVLAFTEATLKKMVQSIRELEQPT